jgi:hypothetical protein
MVVFRSNPETDRYRLVPTKGDVLDECMFQLVNADKLEFHLKMLGPCVLITVTAVLKLLVSLYERHGIYRFS